MACLGYLCLYKRFMVHLLAKKILAQAVLLYVEGFFFFSVVFYFTASYSKEKN